VRPATVKFVHFIARIHRSRQRTGKGDTKAELIKGDNPTSAKRDPSENRGLSLKFPRYFVRYGSRYKQSASVQSQAFWSRWANASLKFGVVETP